LFVAFNNTSERSSGALLQDVPMPFDVKGLAENNQLFVPADLHFDIRPTFLSYYTSLTLSYFQMC
jgi:hypothetical protein